MSVETQTVWRIEWLTAGGWRPMPSGIYASESNCRARLAEMQEQQDKRLWHPHDNKPLARRMCKVTYQLIESVEVVA